MRRLGGALLGLLLFVTGCSTGGDSTAAGSELTIATDRIAQGLDPAVAQVATRLRSYGAAEGLTKIQSDGNVEPELAESVEQTSPTQWTATLPDGARFWSGAPVDARAVVASLSRSRDLNDVALSFLEGVRMTAVDARTVRFETDGPSAWLPYALAHYSLVIYNAARYPAEAGPVPVKTADFTGPFRVTAFDPETQAVLERNNGWRGKPVPIERIVVRKVSDAQARAQLALAGQADIVAEMPSERAAEIEQRSEMRIESAPQGNTVAVYLNPRSEKAPALANPRVRQALAWAVNREQVAEIAGEGLAVPLPSWLASNPAFEGADRHGYTRYDPELAGRLLDEAGWRLNGSGQREGNGRPLSFRLLTWGTEQATGEVIQAQWKRIGVTVDLSFVDKTLVDQVQESGDWDAFTEAWSTLGGVPNLIATQIAPDGGANYARLDLPQVPRLLDRAAAAPSEGERTEAILALNELMAETVPSVPVHPRVEPTAVAERVKGFVAHPLQYENIVQPGMTLG